MKTRRIVAVLAALALLFCALPISAGASDTGIKNVIMMIGDGMGENHLNLAKQQGVTLFMEDNCDERGQSKTRSVSTVTDSAAGATALSCGVRVINGTLGFYATDPLGLFSMPRSITEVAIDHGMKTGIVTTDSTAGATPSGYSVHTSSRKNTQDICDQQVLCDVDLIWGAACSSLNQEAAAANGFQVISTKDEMDALDGTQRSFGQFSGEMWRCEIPEGDDSPTLSEMTVKAIDLLDDDPDGFFLMVEGAHIDKQSHKTEEGAHYPQKVADAAQAVEEFDNAIEAAVTYARERGDTLVVVTADHETGAIQLIDGEYTYTSGSHSAANVPLFVYGSDTLIPNGTAVDNKSIPARIAQQLGWSSSELPASQPGSIAKMFKALIEAIQSLTKIG